jgi:hypothetical protein
VDLERDKALLEYNLLRARNLEKKDYKDFVKDLFDVNI